MAVAAAVGEPARRHRHAAAPTSATTTIVITAPGTCVIVDTRSHGDARVFPRSAPAAARTAPGPRAGNPRSSPRPRRRALRRVPPAVCVVGVRCVAAAGRGPHHDAEEAEHPRCLAEDPEPQHESRAVPPAARGEQRAGDHREPDETVVVATVHDRGDGDRVQADERQSRARCASAPDQREGNDDARGREALEGEAGAQDRTAGNARECGRHRGEERPVHRAGVAPAGRDQTGNGSCG